MNRTWSAIVAGILVWGSSSSALADELLAVPMTVDPGETQVTAAPSSVDLTSGDAEIAAPADKLIAPTAGTERAPDVELAAYETALADRTWYAGVELTILRTRYSNSEFSLYPDSARVGPRLVVGVEDGEGHGARARFWGISDEVLAQRDSPLELGVYNDPVSYTAWRIDLESYERWQIHHTDIVLGVSFTVANLRMDESLSREFSVFAQHPPTADSRAFWLSQEQGEYIGVGPTHQTAAGLGLFVEAKKAFRRTPVSEWSTLLRGRSALLVGEWKSPERDGRVSGDATMVIHEAALGFEYERRLGRSVAWARCLAEYQAWDTTLIDDLSFAGITVGAGFDW